MKKKSKKEPKKQPPKRKATKTAAKKTAAKKSAKKAPPPKSVRKAAARSSEASDAKPLLPQARGPRGNRRPRPGITHDNRFFWEGVRQGRLLIQRCASCKRLRHPPGPMCPHCRSLDWDTLQSSGRGTVYSYVRHYHPSIPPFEPGHPIALIELEEGTRLVSDLVGIDGDDVRIGLKVAVEFNAIDEELTLPQFRPI